MLRLSEKLNGARVHAQEACQGADDRSLSRAVGAKQAENLPLSDLEIHVVQRQERAVPLDHVFYDGNVHVTESNACGKLSVVTNVTKQMH